jgi:hypothetical protein
MDQLTQIYRSLIKIAVIKQLSNGDWQVQSHKGKNLGTYKTKQEAVKRLKIVEFFKHHDSQEVEDKCIDLTKVEDFSYSAVMRSLKQQATEEQIKVFLRFFKKEFDSAVKKRLQKPEKIALQNALIKFNKQHPIKVKKKLVKSAALSELGDAAQVGKYLADIVRFTLSNLPTDMKTKAIKNLKNKFYTMNATEIAQKNLPPTSAIGQSITFVKHVLFNHEESYIREVLNNLSNNLHE